MSCPSCGGGGSPPLRARFFFQAEDGIRDWSVTGVLTCALPIWARTAQIAGPLLALGFEQAALLRITAAIIIAIKMRAFFSSGCFHDYKLYASDEFACASIYTEDWKSVV